MKTMHHNSRIHWFLILLCAALPVTAQEAPPKADVPDKKAAESLKITLTSVLVDDQAKALKFYTEVLGFVKKTDVRMVNARWLTVVSPEQQDGPELLLEPMAFAPAKTYQKALFDAGIPQLSFAVADITATHARLQKLGVVFRATPIKMVPGTVATFEDTCGNLIQIVQQ